MKTFKILGAAAALTLSLSAGAAHAGGTVVAAGDEWLLTNSAYQGTYLGGTTALVNNIAATFGGTNYLLLTGDAATGGQSGLSSLAAQLQSLGKTVSYSADLPTDLTGYDAVFHIGQYISSTAPLTSFLNNGGNVYLSLGGGYYYGSPSAEAAFWNPFLANYGLVAGSTWFSLPQFVNVDVTSGPPGVTNLLWGYGQSIEAIPQTTGVSYVRGNVYAGPQNVGLIGTSRMLIDPRAVPEPASWAMMIGGFALVGGTLRRRKLSVRFA